VGVSQNKESLSSLTLRQLRHEASALGVPLYSRKKKSGLIKEILLYQEKKDKEDKLLAESSKDESVVNEFSISNDGATKIVFLPRDPQWAYVFWEISERDRHKALSQGATRLSLRLLDVTGNSNGEANKGALREVIVDSHSTEWYLPIPLSDRNYQIELGYRYRAQWISLAFSSPAKVPSQKPSELILDQFVPFSLDSVTSSYDENLLKEESGDSGLHQRLYQSATNTLKTRRGSEEFQENSLVDQGLQNITDSGSGIWASGRNESGVGILPVQKPFWLVADAELIVYGATDPSATLTIGSENVPLASDGTFRLQVPFRDGSQTYEIRALDAEGKEQRNIVMKFERVTPEDNTNPKDKASSEWF
tara:strand:+ start:4456 stop:5547 length:1092 start_codon:yes stop_codon:yes gene_type:complete